MTLLSPVRRQYTCFLLCLQLPKMWQQNPRSLKNVTHVLNVATYVKNYFEGRIKYINMRINDYTDVAILPCFPNAFKFIDEGRVAGCVLVHCNAGVSRAAAICIGYVMRTEGMSFQDAFKHVKSKRPKIDPNAGFIHQLERVYTQTLKEENVEIKRK